MMVGGKERDTGRDPAFASAFLINELKDGSWRSSGAHYFVKGCGETVGNGLPGPQSGRTQIADSI
jgi:hypothetical protein